MLHLPRRGRALRHDVLGKKKKAACWKWDGREEQLQELRRAPLLLSALSARCSCGCRGAAPAAPSCRPPARPGWRRGEEKRGDVPQLGASQHHTRLPRAAEGSCRRPASKPGELWMEEMGKAEDHTLLSAGLRLQSLQGTEAGRNPALPRSPPWKLTLTASLSVAGVWFQLRK